ncbi:MAG: hypothetical protein KGL52_04720 [Rhodospirillales bacterium]|nr:hypothetical protein [Rhodospirillales bacterium]
MTRRLATTTVRLRPAVAVAMLLTASPAFGQVYTNNARIRAECAASSTCRKYSIEYPPGVIPGGMGSMLPLGLRRFLSRPSVLWRGVKGAKGLYFASWNSPSGHHFTLEFTKIGTNNCLISEGAVDGIPLSPEQLGFVVDRIRAGNGG